MSTRIISRTPGWAGGALLLFSLVGGGGALAAWKGSALRESAEAAGGQAEPMEVVRSATVAPRQHRASATSVGTVLALRSVTLRNEIAGTVRRVALQPGRIVEPGTVLVALDVSVEEASLRALEAQRTLAETTLSRLLRMVEQQAVSQEEVDRARAERDVAVAEIARISATIARKTILAPFRARVGLADVHPGQYLSEGTVLTTLQSVEDAAHVDFAVAQSVAARLRVGDTVRVSAPDAPTVAARIVAVDARVDPATRNTWVRARLNGEVPSAAPGASVRVLVPFGEGTEAAVVPVSAVRKGPAGDHVFVIAPDGQGNPRAHVRPVKAGEVLGDEVLILEGLQAGEVVAASGAFKLREGVLVAVADETGLAGNGGQ